MAVRQLTTEEVGIIPGREQDAVAPPQGTAIALEAGAVVRPLVDEWGSVAAVLSALAAAGDTATA